MFRIHPEKKTEKNEEKKKCFLSFFIFPSSLSVSLSLITISNTKTRKINAYKILILIISYQSPANLCYNVKAWILM